jgi:hypothetical protein
MSKSSGAFTPHGEKGGPFDRKWSLAEWGNPSDDQDKASEPKPGKENPGGEMPGPINEWN